MLLSQASGRENIGEFAREAAEAHLEWLRIRKFRGWLYEKAGSLGAAPRESLMELADQFARLDRYERRALSRRKRAFRLI